MSNNIDVLDVGGFGSSPEQMAWKARRVGEHLGKSAIGINFREASQHIDELASVIDGKIVYLHSLAVKPVMRTIRKHKVLPVKLVSVATPVSEQIPKLIRRAIAIESGLIEGDEQMEQKFNASDELLHHFFANAWRVLALSQSSAKAGRALGFSHFNAIEDIAGLQEQGVDTTLALMRNERLFDLSTPNVEKSLHYAQTMGTKVIGIEGGHCRYTNDPIGVLDEIEVGSPFFLEEVANAPSPVGALALAAA